MKKAPKKIYLGIDDDGYWETLGRTTCEDSAPMVWTNRKLAAFEVRDINEVNRGTGMEPLRVVAYALVEEPKRKKGTRK